MRLESSQRLPSVCALVLGAAMGLLGGCGDGAGPGKGGAPSSPRVLRIAFSRIERADLELMREQAARFARAHPGWQVRVVAQAWRTTDIHDLYARFLALGDPSVDLYVIDDPWIPEFAFAGWIRPLPELEPWARKAIHPAGLRGAFYRGRLYAVPYELSANALFYRKDLLAQAGLAPPRSLEELLAQAARLKTDHGLAQGLVLHANYVHNDVYPFLWASGGGPLGPDGKVRLDAPENRAVLTQLAGAFAEGRAVPSRADMLRLGEPGRHGYHDAVADFFAGRAAFMINWLRAAAAAEVKGSPIHDRVGVMAIPGLAGRGQGATLGSWCLAVNASSRHPAMARALVQFLSEPAQVEERYLRLGVLPPLAASYRPRAGAPVPARLRTAEPVLREARQRLPLPNERELNEIAERALRDVLFRGAPAPATLAAADREQRALVAAFPKEALAFPPAAPEAAGRAVKASRRLLYGLGALWALALGLGVAYFIADRRRGLFSKLSLRFAVLGFSTTLLAVITSMVISLVVLIESQEDAIREARAIFRSAILEHSRSLGRQIALGASMIREAVDGARVTARQAGGASPGADPLETIYVQALDVLTAEGNYSDDIMFLQVLHADGTVASDELDFLTRELLRGKAASRPLEDPELRRVVRFGRRLMVRDVPAGTRPAHLEVLVPLVERGRHAGAVRIGYSKARQDERIQAFQARQDRLLRRGIVLVAGFAGVLVVLGAVLLLLMARGVSGPLVELRGQAERIGQGDLEVHCAIHGHDEVAALGCHMNQMVDGLREREQIRETFGRFLGPGVSEMLLAGEVELGGEERLVTVLFSDLRGFTTISERLAPTDVVKMLNVYFNEMVDAVFAHGGMLDKFMGDGLMAVFGAPQPDPEHALHAVQAALEMRARLVQVNRQLEASGLPALQLGVGLHTGQAILGNIGSLRRMEYTAIGDTVNLASRLEGVTKQFGVDIAMSSATRAALGDAVENARLGELVVKGKTVEVEVFSVLGLRKVG